MSSKAPWLDALKLMATYPQLMHSEKSSHLIMRLWGLKKNNDKDDNNNRTAIDADAMGCFFDVFPFCINCLLISGRVHTV